ncbi:MAG: helix-turn-helix domain-containing protein [Ginsengibacter sp.]|jgi:transcriptional regulator GlxA family with amidase domain
MKHITILATPGINIGSIDNPRRAFLTVNDYLEQRGEPPFFKVIIAGSSKEIPLDNGLCTLHADVEIKDLLKTDLIIIPAFEGDLQKGLEQSSVFIPWIIHQYNHGAEIASLCVGAFLLAASGLLNGKSCSTHWRAANEFKRLFPDVQLLTEKVITDEQGIYTSGGAFSSANLVLYLIEKFTGREAAIHCAKMFQVDLDRHTQSPFIIFEGQKDHQDEPVKRAQTYIEENYQNRISVDQLTSLLALSRRNFERRFKKATTNTAVEYIQRVKIEAAKKFFEVTNKNISEVMYDVGYSDVKSFRSVFRRITGLSPIEYRNKYNRELVMI